MKHTKFVVWFSNSTYDPQMVIVWAFNRSQAIILAKAERIKAGSDYTLSSVVGATSGMQHKDNPVVITDGC